MYNNVFSCSSSPWVAFDDMWFHQHRLIWRTNGEIWHDTNHINLFGVEYLDPLIWEVCFILSFFYCSSLPPKVLLLLESVFQGLVEWTNLISLKWLSLLCSWGLIWLLCSLGMEMDWAVTVVILWGHTNHGLLMSVPMFWPLLGLCQDLLTCQMMGWPWPRAEKGVLRKGWPWFGHLA